MVLVESIEYLGHTGLDENFKNYIVWNHKV